MRYLTQGTWYIIAVLAVLSTSIINDQLTKVLVEHHLLLWESDSDLRSYRGKTVPVMRLGDRTESNSNSFFLEFNFNYVRNQGAAWGFLSDLKDSIRIPFFHLVTILAVVMLIFYFRSTPLQHRTARLALILILSGALGNFIDRLRLGYVIDFLDFRWNIPFPIPIKFTMDFWPQFLDFLNVSVNASSWRYNFPNFNWADSMITVGVLLLLVDMIVLERIRESSEAQKPESLEAS